MSARWARSCLVLALLLGSGIALGDDLEVDIAGLSGELRDNYLAHLGKLPESLSGDEDGLDKRLRHALEAGLQPFGYYAPQLDWTLQGRQLKLKIDKGKAVQFEAPEIRVEGEASTIAEIAALVAEPPIKPGTPLRHSQYETLRAGLLDLARSYGFLDARYSHSRLVVDLDRDSARAELALLSGPRYRFGETRIQGGRIDADVLARLNPVVSGEPFAQKTVTSLTRQLQDTGYFRRVDVRTVPDAEHVVDLEANLEPANRHRFDFGLGYSTDSSLRGRIGWIQPTVNSRGHSQRSELFLSQPTSHLDMTYRIPGKHPLHDALEFSTGYQTREIQDNPLDTGTLGAHFTTLRSSGWQWTYGAALHYEDYSVSAQDEADILYLAPDISATRLKLAPGTDPQRGYRLTAGAEGSHETMGAQANWLRVDGSARWLHGFSDARTLVLLRGELGVILTDDVDQVPLSRRFFTGGDQSVRGYGFESISPLDDLGEPSGGKYLNVASVELSRLLRTNWRLALFADAGRAYTENNGSWSRSVGFGVRYLTPLGQIRVDLGFPLQDPEADTFRIHFSIGPAL